MPLTNAEKQRRWRTAHADRRRTAARITSMLMRRSHATGRTSETQYGWNTVMVDGYFYSLAGLLCDLLKTDRAINQLKWALASCVNGRKRARRERLWPARCDRARSREQSIEWSLDG